MTSLEFLYKYFTVYNLESFLLGLYLLKGPITVRNVGSICNTNTGCIFSKFADKNDFDKCIGFLLRFSITLTTES